MDGVERHSSVCCNVRSNKMRVQNLFAYLRVCEERKTLGVSKKMFQKIINFFLLAFDAHQLVI